MQPFDFQVQCLYDVYQCFRQGFRRVVLVAGCGAGKTFMAGMMLHAVTRSAHRRCLFLVDRNNLLEQSVREFEGMGIHCTILQGDQWVDWEAPVIVASCQTIEARIRGSLSTDVQVLEELLGHLDLIIVDECHETA